MKTSEENQLVNNGFMLLRESEPPAINLEVKDSVSDWRFFAPFLSKKARNLALKVFSKFNKVKIIKEEENETKR